jgi:putative SOS response-associated peptidase YedK
MCGRYTLATPDPADVRARFPVGEEVDIRRRYNVAPGDGVLAVTFDHAGAPRGELLRWGFVPTWAKKPETGLKMINARVETAPRSPAFGRAFERYRCLIIADGFYEWRAASGLGAGRRRGAKQPFHITRADGELFAFAGLWSIWHGDDGQRIRSCAILTTAANSAIAPLHDRMPVILAPQHESAWLEASTPRDELDEILVGLAPSAVALAPVGQAVNDARYDGPDCLLPAVHPGQAALF